MRTRLSTEQRRAQLLDIGTKLFAQRSYADVSIEEVASMAKISSGLLYHYFPSKHAFFTAIVEVESSKLLHASRPDSTLTMFDQVKSGVAVYIDYAARFPDNYRLAHTDGAANDDLRRIQEARAAALRDRILGGVATMRPVDAQDTIAITGWLAFVRFTIFAWLDDPAIDRDTLRDLCARTLWGALALPVIDTASPPTATS